MSEKVKLPKEVCDALDEAIKTHPINSSIILFRSYENAWKTKETIILNKISTEVIMRALVLGYEPELTAEQKLEELYWNPVDVEEFEIEAHRKAIRDAFQIQGIHYDWLEDDAE